MHPGQSHTWRFFAEELTELELCWDAIVELAVEVERTDCASFNDCVKVIFPDIVEISLVRGCWS